MANKQATHFLGVFMNTGTEMTQTRQELTQKPFGDYFQVSKENAIFIEKLASANPHALKILLFILRKMDRYNALVCSYKVFEEYFNISKRTVTRAISHLKKHGFIYVKKSGSSNVYYIVNSQLAWSSWTNNLKYCEFPANVILTYSEQEEEE